MKQVQSNLPERIFSSGMNPKLKLKHNFNLQALVGRFFIFKGGIEMNMKKFMKKFAAVSMAVVMTLAFAGCGNDSGTNTGDGAAKFVIGGIGPTTGDAAVYGQGVKNAAEMAVEEINANGGINGYQVEFLWQDDVHDTEKAVNAYNSLKDQGMQMLMGTVTSAPCTAVVALTEEDNMFQLTPSGSAVESIKGDNAFRVCFSDPNQGVGSADYFAENFPNAKVGVVYNSSDVYSNGIFKTFKKEAAAKGVNVVATEAFTKDSAQDFTVQIQKMKESGADLVFLPFYAQEASLFLTQADKAGLDAQFFGCDGLDGLIKQLGSNAQLAEGVMLLTPYAADSDNEASKKFTEAYEAKYDGEVPTQFAADAYDAMYIIKKAAETAGVTPDMSVSDICDAMKKAMTEIEFTGATGTMTWSADGEPTKTPMAMVIKNGEYKSL